MYLQGTHERNPINLGSFGYEFGDFEPTQILEHNLILFIFTCLIYGFYGL